jgi:uncharacterized membrane protein
MTGSLSGEGTTRRRRRSDGFMDVHHVQSAILVVWIAANLIGAMRGWDPYPFILLNLALSFQAAYAAPVIMMSQNRQQDIDRKR